MIVNGHRYRAPRLPRAPTEKQFAAALWLWGRMKDFESDGYFGKDLAKVLAPMPEHMRADMRRIVPSGTEFFRSLSEAVTRGTQ